MKSRGLQIPMIMQHCLCMSVSHLSFTLAFLSVQVVRLCICKVLWSPSAQTMSTLSSGCSLAGRLCVELIVPVACFKPQCTDVLDFHTYRAYSSRNWKKSGNKIQTRSFRENNKSIRTNEVSTVCYYLILCIWNEIKNMSYLCSFVMVVVMDNIFLFACISFLSFASSIAT